MKNIITELYYGNIDPQVRGFKKDSYLQKQMSILSKSEAELTDKLDGEVKKAFLSFANSGSAHGLSTIPLWTAQRRIKTFFGRSTMRAKYHIYLTAEERRVVINSLIDLRNDLISRCKYTDIIDELIIKFTKAKVKKIKIKGGLK